jgi:hypothetical protein
LQLTPDQEKYWPALEEAIKARSTGRQQRLAALASRLNQPGDVDAPELLRLRADNSAQRAANSRSVSMRGNPFGKRSTRTRSGGWAFSPSVFSTW